MEANAKDVKHSKILAIAPTVAKKDKDGAGECPGTYFALSKWNPKLADYPGYDMSMGMHFLSSYQLLQKIALSHK